MLTGLLVAAATAPALADVRTGVLTDGPDPTVAFDIERVTARHDRDAGVLDVTVRLHRPPPQPRGLGHYAVVWIGVNPSNDECVVGGRPDAAGDTHINIERSFSSPGVLEATTYVNFRQEHPTVPVVVSPDGRDLTVRVVDDLLRGANLRCLDAAGSGLGFYDPRQPEGGEDYDSVEPAWFEGLNPRDPRNRPFRFTYNTTSPQRLRPSGSGEQVNLRGWTRCSLNCRVRIGGYALGGGRRVPGLTLSGSYRASGGEDVLMGFNINGRERRLLRSAFRRFGRVVYVVTLTATDDYSRSAIATRRVTLLPPRPTRACRPVLNPYPGTRYEGVDLRRIRAVRVSCRTARVVARGAHRRALSLSPPASGVRRFTWRGWRVTGDLRGASDRYTATRRGARVSWLF
jgi:hypothetical protein